MIVVWEGYFIWSYDLRRGNEGNYGYLGVVGVVFRWRRWWEVRRNSSLDSRLRSLDFVFCERGSIECF